MGNNPSWFSRGKAAGMVVDISDEELKLFPVEKVSWDDAQKFIKKLNEKEVGVVICIACRARRNGNMLVGAGPLLGRMFVPLLLRQANQRPVVGKANFNGNEPFGMGPPGPWLMRPTRVGAYPSNRLGLCDMHGNVSQWTDTAHCGPSGPGRRLGDNGRGCRASERYGLPPTHQDMVLGFRLARVPVR